MSNWATELFGNELLTKEGLKPTAEVLANKSRVAIYFSAHWCPPCRGFTPVLAEFYEQLSEEDESQLEIIFVSSDSDVQSFNSYYGEMPWKSVPFENRAGAQSISSKFGVRGIPALFVLDGATGAVKDSDGRSTVMGAKGNTSKALNHWK